MVARTDRITAGRKEVITIRIQSKFATTVPCSERTPVPLEPPEFQHQLPFPGKTQRKACRGGQPASQRRWQFAAAAAQPRSENPGEIPSPAAVTERPPKFGRRGSGRRRGLRCAAHARPYPPPVGPPGR